MSDFNPPDTTLFSYSADGTSVTATVTYDASKGYSLARTDAGVSSNERVAFRGKAVPGAGPWSSVMRLKRSPAGSSDSTRIGMMLLESSTGKHIIFGLNVESGSIYIDALYFATLDGAFANRPVTRVQCWTGILPEHFRIDLNSGGTTYSFYVSYDEGVTWVLIGTAAVSSYFTADKIGVGCESFSGVIVKPTALVYYYNES